MAEITQRQRQDNLLRLFEETISELHQADPPPTTMLDILKTGDAAQLRALGSDYGLNQHDLMIVRDTLLALGQLLENRFFPPFKWGIEESILPSNQ